MSYFIYNVTTTTEIYTLSLHDALPISDRQAGEHRHADAGGARRRRRPADQGQTGRREHRRSEEHTSELQSRPHLVCRLLLEKKNTKNYSESESAANSSSKCSRLPICPL